MRKIIIIGILMVSLSFVSGCTIDDECLPQDVLEKFEQERNDYTNKALNEGEKADE